MSALALATLAAGNTISGQTLVIEFFVVFFIAAIITIAKGKRDRSPVTLALIMGSITGVVAVLFTLLLASSL